MKSFPLSSLLISQDMSAGVCGERRLGRDIKLIVDHSVLVMYCQDVVCKLCLKSVGHLQQHH